MLSDVSGSAILSTIHLLKNKHLPASIGPVKLFSTPPFYRKYFPASLLLLKILHETGFIQKTGYSIHSNPVPFTASDALLINADLSKKGCAKNAARIASERIHQYGLRLSKVYRMENSRRFCENVKKITKRPKL